MSNVNVRLVREKETKNTVRYVAEDEHAPLELIYVPRTTLRVLGDPQVIELSLAAASPVALAA